MSSSRVRTIGSFDAPVSGRLASIRLRTSDFAALVKLRLTTMVLFSGIVGFVLAAPFSALSLEATLWRLIPFTVGTLMVIGAANAFNQVLERDQDALMRRTKNRPVPAGRIGASQAILFASLLCSMGCSILILGCNPATAAAGLFAVVVYVAIYTPLKAISPWSTAAGAVSGAIPPVMGGLAVTGTVPLSVWCVFGIVFLWQFPHTWAITVLHRDDYQRLGYRMLPLLEGGETKTRKRVVLYSALLVAVSLVPLIYGAVGPVYAVCAIGLGTYIVWASVRFAESQERGAALQLMFATLVYLPVLLSLLALQKVIS